MFIRYRNTDRRTDGHTDGRTDRQTEPLIEFFFATRKKKKKKKKDRTREKKVHSKIGTRKRNYGRCKGRKLANESKRQKEQVSGSQCTIKSFLVMR